MNTAPTPDYRAILLRLIDKIQRNGDYYRKVSRGHQRKAAREPGEAAAHLAKAESLGKVAQDMDFTFERAIERLGPEDIEEVVRTYNLRTTPATWSPSPNAPAVAS